MTFMIYERKITNLQIQLKNFELKVEKLKPETFFDPENQSSNNTSFIFTQNKENFDGKSITVYIDSGNSKKISNELIKAFIVNLSNINF